MSIILILIMPGCSFKDNMAVNITYNENQETDQRCLSYIWTFTLLKYLIVSKTSGLK